MRIGIGVTTFKRPHLMAKCSLQISKFRPPGSSLIIHDDSKTAKGVARSKNSCIGSLMRMGADHVFLFDDDTWPDAPDWWVPYVESDKEHLSYNWFPAWDERRDAWPLDDEAYTGWNTSNGCMLYYTRKALETAGGMRKEFGRWGFEHMEHSYRIHKFGLTPEPFISLTAQEGIYASDRHDEDATARTSTVKFPERRNLYARNADLYRQYIEKEPEFVPYG